jgi:hypothetical protein
MNDDEIDDYLQGLYKKYKQDADGFEKTLEEVREKLLSVRDISIQFSIEEIHDLHMCISECIEYHKNDKRHQKEYPNGCQHCNNYHKLYKRIVMLCDCVDNEANK